jgi:hypothetical protein
LLQADIAESPPPNMLSCPQPANEVIENHSHGTKRSLDEQARPTDHPIYPSANEELVPHPPTKKMTLDKDRECKEDSKASNLRKENTAANFDRSESKSENSTRKASMSEGLGDKERLEFESYMNQVSEAPFSPVKGVTCRYCPHRLFWRRHDLVRHIRTSHLMERPFQCNHCGARFKRKNHVEIHIRAVHEKVVRYTCQYCQKSYTSDSTRRKHIRVVHKTMAYE